MPLHGLPSGLLAMEGGRCWGRRAQTLARHTRLFQNIRGRPPEKVCAGIQTLRLDVQDQTADAT